jgi:hypothetical protein
MQIVFKAAVWDDVHNIKLFETKNGFLFKIIYLQL